MAVTARPRVLTVSVTASVIARAVCCCFWAMRPAKSSSKKRERLAEGVAVQPREHQRVEVRAERQRVQRRAEAHEARAAAPGRRARRRASARPAVGEEPLGPARLGEVDQPADDAGGADLGGADERPRRRARCRSPGRRPRSAQRMNRQSRSGGGPSARAKASIRSARASCGRHPGRVRYGRVTRANTASSWLLRITFINCKEPAAGPPRRRSLGRLAGSRRLALQRRRRGRRGRAARRGCPPRRCGPRRAR